MSRTPSVAELAVVENKAAALRTAAAHPSPRALPWKGRPARGAQGSGAEIQRANFSIAADLHIYRLGRWRPGGSSGNTKLSPCPEADRLSLLG